MSLIDKLRRLEESLLDPEVRKDAVRLSLLLAPNFKEFGKSGRTYSKEQIISLLAVEEGSMRYRLENFQLELETETVALVTYRSVQGGVSALRSSVWIRQSIGWQMLFHQGTLCNFE